MNRHTAFATKAKPVPAPLRETAGAAVPSVSVAGAGDLGVRHDERSRIGRELHDATAQTLVSLQLQVMYLKQISEDPIYLDKLAEVQTTIDELHEEIRAVCFLSSMPALERGMLPSALETMAERFGKLTGLDIRFRTTGSYTGAPVDMKISLYRIAQEALANIFRHAHAHRVEMRLEARRNQLRLIILDDGIGISHDDARWSNGVGARNIERRVQDLGGSLKILRLVRGTRFIVAVPLPVEGGERLKAAI